MAGYVQTVAPASAAVTLAECKTHLRVTASDEDSLIASLAYAATGWLENRTGRALVTQTWRKSLDEWPITSGPWPTAIELPKGHIQSISSITYTDINGDPQTVAASVYTLDASAPIARVVPAYGQVWPVPRYQPEAVQVTFVAGYGSVSDIPTTIKQAALLLVGSWYENRESVITGTISPDLPMGVEALIGPYVLPVY